MTTRISQRHTGIGYMLVKSFRIGFLVLLYYLTQTTVIPHMKLWGIMPNLHMLCIAIMTVSFGKKYAFASGAVLGILLEVMLPSLPIFNLVMYPALALLCAQIFADMSEIRRELLRIRIAQRQSDSRIVAVGGVERKKWYRPDFRRKTADDMEPHLRIFLNTLMLTFLYNLVMLIYLALNGVTITFSHFLRLTQILIYTAIWCLAIFPSRWFLGFYTNRFRRRQREDGLGDEVRTSDKLLHELSLAPDMPDIATAFDTAPVIKEETVKPDREKQGQADPEEEPEGKHAGLQPEAPAEIKVTEEPEDAPGKETADEI